MFVAVFLVALSCFTVGQGLNAGTSVYLGIVGEGSFFAGMLAAVFSASAAAARFVCGPLIDARGRRTVMVGVPCCCSSARRFLP